jgi:hypothetical protein
MPLRSVTNRDLAGGGFAAPIRTGTGVDASGARALPGRNTLNDFVGEGGQPLALPFGKHLIAGQLIFNLYDDSTPAARFAVALGDGGEKGWNSALRATYAGTALSVSPDASTTGYRFHPGTLSTGTGDADQGVDAFFTNALTFNNTAYVAAYLEGTNAAEDRPDKLRGVYECLKVPDFDSVGNLTGWSYSVNPARVCAYGIWRDSRINYPEASDFELQIIMSRRVDWVSWNNFKTQCAATISWDDGTSTRSIPRFECHIAIEEATDVARFLHAVCAIAGTYPQDDGGVWRFATPFDTATQHHFSDGSDGRPCNVVSDSMQVIPASQRDKVRNASASFGDTDDDYLLRSSVPYRDEALIEKFGEQRQSPREFTNMTHSQAQRLLRRQVVIENSDVCTLRGLGDSLHLLPGDFVTVTSAHHKWDAQKCLVANPDVLPAESSADEVEFTLIKCVESFYSDDWHTEKQNSVAAA